MPPILFHPKGHFVVSKAFIEGLLSLVILDRVLSYMIDTTVWDSLSYSLISLPIWLHIIELWCPLNLLNFLKKYLIFSLLIFVYIIICSFTNSFLHLIRTTSLISICFGTINVAIMSMSSLDRLFIFQAILRRPQRRHWKSMW